MTRRWSAVLAHALLLAGITGCVDSVTHRLTPSGQVQTLDRHSPFLKIHGRDGSLWVLSSWTVQDSDRVVAGHGSRFDVHREAAGEGAFRVPLDSVVLFETNVTHAHPTVAVLAVVTGASLALTAACVINPKACFGCCPTFYCSDGRKLALQAEGFSASVSPSLEATDVDALFRAAPASRSLEIVMRNEALETHVVRSVRVLAAPRDAGTRVFATAAGEYWQAREIRPPLRAIAEGQDCTAALAAMDGQERSSAADSADLAARGTIELEFPAIGPGDAGLVIATRQSLLSTYLYYQALAWLGRSAGDWMAALERGDPATRGRTFDVGGILGGIEVEARDSSGLWRTVGRCKETGPLASDTHLVRLPPGGGAAPLRLRMARGAWRLDWVALVRLERRVEPLRIEPSAVRRMGRPDAESLRALLDPARALVTSPGDEVALDYQLPEDFTRYELFLESRGYYLEWMREEWLAEENPAKAALLFLDPAGSLKRMAPEFKREESRIDSTFWASRYAHP